MGAMAKTGRNLPSLGNLICCSPQRPLAITSANMARTRYGMKSFELVASPQGRCRGFVGSRGG